MKTALLKLKSKQITNEDTLKFIQRFLAIFMLIAPMILLAFYLLGFASVFENDISVLNVFHLISSIFSFVGIRAITNTIICVVYILLLILFIKNIIRSIIKFKTAFSGPREQETMVAFIYLLDSLGRCFYYSIAFMMLLRLADTITLNIYAILTIILGILANIICRFALDIWKDGKVFQYSYFAICNLIFYIVCTMFIISICNIDSQTLHINIQYTLNTLSYSSFYSAQTIVSSLFTSIVVPIVYLVFQIISLNLIKNAFTSVKYNDSDNRNAAKKLFIASAVFGGLAITIISFKAGRFVGLDSFHDYLVVLIRAAALFVSFLFPQLDLYQNQTSVEAEQAIETESIHEEKGNI